MKNKEKLYAVEVSATIMVVAKDPREAERIAKYNINEVIEYDCFVATDVPDESHIDYEWRNSIPYGLDRDDERTCIEYLQELIASQKASVLVLENREEHVLLLYKNRRDPIATGFSLPGGKLEDDESELDAVIRETKEETGIDVPAHLVFKRGNAVSHNGRNVAVFYAKMDIGNDKIKLSSEHSSYTWAEKGRLLSDQEYTFHYAGRTQDFITLGVQVRDLFEANNEQDHS